ncbi:hypothetical protein BDQ17DRAFT_1540116 [Cyathus striatus]|nr:hypothetical protein BDQ17DRAFT_1540116 [Cyathus striatus]
MFATALRVQARIAFSTCRAVAPRRTLSCNPTRPVLPINNRFSPAMLSRGFKYEAVENSEPTETLFIANLPYNATERDIREVFSPFGKIKEIKIPLDKYGESRGFGHVRFERLDDAINARTSSEEDAIRINANTLRVLYNVHHRPKSDTLSIRCPDVMEEEEVRSMFENFRIVDIRFVPPGGRYNSSLTFVQFENAHKADLALETIKREGQMRMGMSIVFARPQPPKGTIIDRVDKRRMQREEDD